MFNRLIRQASFFAAAVIVAAVASAQDTPFVAVAKSDGVNVRAGAGQNYYVVANLKKGDLVTVHQNVYGWYRIDPPAGAFSFIAKNFVKAAADGKTGSVTGNQVKVRAPSPAGPDNSYRTQLTLDEGATVQILGEVGSYYKIAPPAGAHVFVHGEYLAQATAEQIAAAQARAAEPAPAPAAPAAAPAVAEAPAAAPIPVPMPGAPAKPAAAPAPAAQPAITDAEPAAPAAAPSAPATAVTTVTPAPATAEETPAPEPAPEMKPEAPARAPAAEASVPAPMPAPAGDAAEPATTEKPAATEAEKPSAATKPAEAAEPAKPRSTTQLAELEQRYITASKLPLAEQPIGDLRMAYEMLLAAEDLADYQREVIKIRIELLTNRQELQNSMKQIQAVKQEMAAADKARAEEDARKPKSYIAVGRLTASTLYSGEKLPLLYRLVDPLSGLTIAYVQLKPGSLADANSLLNQYVGVIGERNYDPALKLNIILTEQIDALHPAQKPAPKADAPASESN